MVSMDIEMYTCTRCPKTRDQDVYVYMLLCQMLAYNFRRCVEQIGCCSQNGRTLCRVKRLTVAFPQLEPGLQGRKLEERNAT